MEILLLFGILWCVAKPNIEIEFCPQNYSEQPKNFEYPDLKQFGGLNASVPKALKKQQKALIEYQQLLEKKNENQNNNNKKH